MNRRFLVTAVLALLLIGAVAAAVLLWQQLGSPGLTSRTGSAELSDSNGLPTSVVPSKQLFGGGAESPAFLPTESLPTQEYWWDDLEDPYQHLNEDLTRREPCYVSGTQLCLQSFSGETTTTSFSLKGELVNWTPSQTSLTTFLWGRMLAHPGALAQFYQDANQKRFEPQPYYHTFIRIHDAAATHQINPGALYAALDYGYTVATSSGEFLGSAAQTPTWDIDRFASLWRSGISFFVEKQANALQSDPVATRLNNRDDWSQHGKALAYAVIKSVSPDLASRYLAKKGGVSIHYGQIASVDFGASRTPLQFEATTWDANAFYNLAQPNGLKSTDFVVCRTGTAYACDVNAARTSAQCRAANFLNYFCSSLDLIGLQGN